MGRYDFPFGWNVTQEEKPEMNRYTATPSKTVETVGHLQALSHRYTVVDEVENFILRFANFSDVIYVFPIALWVIGTYLWENFDAYPYMVVTSGTKRSGKTRLAELLSMLVNKPRNFGAMTPYTLFASIEEEKPTIFFDEAEPLSGAAADMTMRSVLNMGYRKGQKVPRRTARFWDADANGGAGSYSTIKEFDTYCPKCFILIGDVRDTLRDRAIIISMKRGEPRERFVFDKAKMDADSIKASLAHYATVPSKRDAIIETYQGAEGLDFLTDRDEEIWLSLWSIMQVICPDRAKEFCRDAVDIATEKTQERKSYVNLQGEGAEAKARDDEYSKRLLQDLCEVINGDKAISTIDAVKRLRELPTAPWRKFRGSEGLTLHNLSDLLRRHDVRPTNIRFGGSKGRVVKGYKFDQVKKAIEKAGDLTANR